ncbi:MAG: hypothetical protein U1C50_04470 [Patescibacteria group bacterium]|nr:hypothetical protein [Candidatus Beckwithbacteria bacterium]MDZ4229475.1 hypothetical protein [Patescibacteria group bacterium]
MAQDQQEKTPPSSQLEFTYREERYPAPLVQDLQSLQSLYLERTYPVLKKLATSLKPKSADDQTKTGLALVLFSSPDDPLDPKSTNLIDVMDKNPTHNYMRGKDFAAETYILIPAISVPVRNEVRPSVDFITAGAIAVPGKILFGENMPGTDLNVNKITVDKLKAILPNKAFLTH